jgi:hypothetical protein
MTTTARTLRRAALALAFLALTPVGTHAQSTTSVWGLGYPLLPTDARTEVMGGLGIGLKGLAAPLTNPAAAASVGRRGAIVSASAVEQDATFGDQSDASGATRFPLIHLLFPAGPVVVTAGYGGYLDQSWGVTRAGQVSEGTTQVGYSDVVVSNGGIGQAQVGVAVPLGRRFALGGAVGAYTGSQTIAFSRRFDATTVGDLQSFSETWKWQYTAPMAQLGMRWDPVDILRVGASLTWAGTLRADSAEGPASGSDYQLPLQLAGGASAFLAPGLLAAVSGRWSGWSSVGTVSAPAPVGTVDAAASDTWEVGAGLEWADPSERATRAFPVRIGVQYRQLPFSFGGGTPTEWFAGGGLGLRLGVDRENPLTRIDLSVLRGERTAPGPAGAGDLKETAWRFGLTLSIFGG